MTEASAGETALATYFSPEFARLPFCPGCGHDALLKALDKALVALQLPPEKVVIVTDIGCIGLSERFFVTNGFHGLHGRAITYACGLKLARPELHVIVLMGDGGCGIGGAHLLNVARRNIGITLIVANNFNYGMTGGQQSVTTPHDGCTAPTPGGNPEEALDVCATVIAAGAPWVYRGTVYDRDLAERLAEAILEPRFTLLDIWEICTAYYAPRNRFNKKAVFDLLERSGAATGLLADRPRPELAAHYRERAATGDPQRPKRRPIALTHGSALDRQVGLVIAGSAGNKIRSGGTTFASAAIASGLRATQKDDYPITVMTGHSITEVILSPDPIDYTAIEQPDYFLLLSEDGLKRSRKRIAALPEHAVLYAEASLEIPETRARVVRLPLAATAKRINRTTLATVALGALLGDRALFPLEAFRAAIQRFQNPEVAALNLRALEAGAALVTEQPPD
jgi:Pyruvate/2-oxoacid:ferredoxin oxidoreductase gamma subunit